MKHAYMEAEQRCEHDRTDPDGEVAALQRRIRELEVEVKGLRMCHAVNTRLIDEMEAELAAEKALTDRLTELLSDRFEQLDSAAARAAWNDEIEAAARPVTAGDTVTRIQVKIRDFKRTTP